MKSFKQLKEELSKESDTIVVDGVTRSRLNSNGKLIYPTEDGIINFWKWFGNSQVVDKNGFPIVMYHATVTWQRSDGRQLGDIHSFNRKASTDIVRRPPSADTVGSWFSNKVQGGADQYGDTFYPVYLKVMDAKRTTFDGMKAQAYELDKGFRPSDEHDNYTPNTMEPYRAWLKEEGYDGLSMIHDVSNKNSTEFLNQIVYVVLEPNQIKSAIGNKGTFDGSSDKIVEAEQLDMFQSDFANKRSTVKKTKVVSSKGASEVQTFKNVNSNGKAIALTKQALDNFWNWFDGSEVVDDKGRPLIVYHGTRTDVSKFQTGLATKNTGLFGFEYDAKRHAVFFTPNLKFANSFAQISGEGSNVMPVYLFMSKPADLRKGLPEQLVQDLDKAGFNLRIIHNIQYTWELFDEEFGGDHFVECLKKAGYDGVIFNEQDDDENITLTFAVFDSNQVKSAVGNKGSFNVDSPNITESVSHSSITKAIVAAKQVQDRLNAFDIDEEINSVSENGEVDLSGLLINPQYYDQESEEFTDAGYKKIDELTRERAIDNIRPLQITDIDDLNNADHKAKYAAFVALLDSENIEYRDTSSNSSKYIEVLGHKVRFANHANMVRDTSIRGQLPIINVAPNETTFTELLGLIKNWKQLSERVNKAVKIKPLYVHRPLLNPQPLIRWAQEQGFTKTLAPDDFHVTIVYSKKPINWNKFTPDTSKFKNTNDDRAMDKFGDAVVLKFVSPTLNKRHFEFKEGGASWDHPDYQPHITITYDGGDVDVKTLQPYTGLLAFGAEEFEDLDEDWSDSIDEVVA